MCPTCHTTLDQSNSAAAHQIEAFIAVRIARCESEEQIKTELIANWGTVILAAPPRKGFDLLVWWLPLGGIIARRRRSSASAPGAGAGPARHPTTSPSPTRRRSSRIDELAGAIRLMATRLPIAFLAGFASVITPCVLPLVPGYLSALSGVEGGRLGERGTTRSRRAREPAVHPRVHRRLRRPRRRRGSDRQRLLAARADGDRRLRARRARARVRRAAAGAGARRCARAPVGGAPARIRRTARRCVRRLRGAVHRHRARCRARARERHRHRRSRARCCSPRTRSGSARRSSSRASRSRARCRRSAGSATGTR